MLRRPRAVDRSNMASRATSFDSLSSIRQALTLTTLASLRIAASSSVLGRSNVAAASASACAIGVHPEKAGMAVFNAPPATRSSKGVFKVEAGDGSFWGGFETGCRRQRT